ncbi:MAG: PfkB family carbohydrate kinase [Bacteroidota bacterium]
MQKTLIIGAQNIDLFARSDSDYVLHDSNLSKIHLAFGGVGCNIASNLSTLGNLVDFMTVFGDDYFAQLAKQNLDELNINYKESRVVKGIGNSIYLGIMDKANDLYLGLNDMDIINKLDVAFFKDKTQYIESFDVLVIDNNLSLESLQYLLIAYKHKKIIMDAVSATKAIKLQELLSYISLLKLNVLELDALSNKAVTSEKLNELIKRGLSSVILTNSGQDIIYKSTVKHIVTNPKTIEKIENATGAGDAFLAGFIHGLLQEKSTEDCLGIAKNVAYKCLQSPNSTIQKSN